MSGTQELFLLHFIFYCKILDIPNLKIVEELKKKFFLHILNLKFSQLNISNINTMPRFMLINVYGMGYSNESYC